jgi:3-dehydroquinate dehydratase-2
MKKIFILNGPNLNLLGTREPRIYGYETLADIEIMCKKTATEAGFEIVFYQSNHEGELIEYIHDIGKKIKQGKALGAIFNPGAFTHTSIALHDAIIGACVPLIEVHITNVHSREVFRHHSYISPASSGVIIGMGIYGYILGIQGLIQKTQ